MNATQTSNDKAVFEAVGICKNYGGVKALDNVDLNLMAGEVLALVGDNGAGKSTLVKAITGAISKDGGSIYFDGKEAVINEPADAKHFGIETVYQDLALVNELNVTRNIFLGREILLKGLLGKWFGFLDYKKMHQEVIDLFDKLNISIHDLHREASDFSGGQRQAVALSKTVQFGKRVAILDEPTAALGVKESHNAMQLVKSLKEHGLSVIMVTHNMQHVLQYCDRVMVMRLGKKVAVRSVSDIDGDQLVGLITGATNTHSA